MGSVHAHRGPATRPWVGAASFSLLAASATLLLGCGSDDGGTDPTTSSAGTRAKTVRISDYLYKPASITVSKGTTVTFSNGDSTPHTATSKQSGAFESGSIDTGKTGEVTLEASGTFAYYCLFHPFMKGTITVE